MGNKTGWKENERRYIEGYRCLGTVGKWNRKMSAGGRPKTTKSEL